MPKMIPRYVHLVRSRGRAYTYYRRGGQRRRIVGGFALRGGALEPSPEWLAAYARLHAGFEAEAQAGSLAALIAAYKAAPEYRQLAPKTRRDYARYLDALGARFGPLPVAAMPRAVVFKWRDRFAATPRSANYAVAVLRRLLSFAVDRGWRADNPALRPGRLRTGPGHRPWEEGELAAFRAAWPAATRERVAFELLLGSGQRGQDVAAMTRRHYRRGRLWVRQIKTDARLEIPCSAELRAVLDPWLARGPGGGSLALLPARDGRPLGVDRFRHVMRAAIAGAGLEGLTVHGLRTTAATVLREIGCSWADIEAVLGHRTVEMLRHYTRQRRHAELAVARLDEARRERGSNPPR